ncbi:hypothetical protein ACFO9E_11365 [Streptomyces maoxianensis]|uniref:Uncharacterized protein n=1 Tax=Streptomyces maoxianensis TaxID=1459942 RepID=A0ABV9G251_9ACTN
MSSTPMVAVARAAFIEVDRANKYGAKIESKLPQFLAFYQHYHQAELPPHSLPGSP